MLPYLYLGIGRMLLHQKYKLSVVVAGVGLLGNWGILLVLNLRKRLPDWIRSSVIPVIVILSLWVSGVYRFCGYFDGWHTNLQTEEKW